MKMLLAILSLLLITSLSAQERVGNGEGLGEQRVTTINEYLPFYINICLQGGCMMTSDELVELKSLLNYRNNDPKLVFLSALKNPDVFEPNGLLSIIQTTRDLKSEVKINTDKLYNELQAINFDKALTIVVSIYDYKANKVTNLLLIKKLMLALTQTITTSQHSFDFSYIKFSLYRSSLESQKALFVYDAISSFNLLTSLQEYFKCSKTSEIILKKVSWLDLDKQFSLLIEGNGLCLTSHTFRLQVDLNLKVTGGYYPGRIPRVKLDEEQLIHSVLNL